MTRAGRGFVLALALSFSPPLGAQGVMTLPDSGARVRLLRAGDRTWREATFLTIARDTLLFQPFGCCVVEAVPLSGLHALEVSRGRHSSYTDMIGGTALGLFAGVAAGALVGKVQCNISPSELCGVGAYYSVVVLGGAGLLTGAVIGAQPRERWARVYPPRRAALWVVPGADGGVVFGVTLALGSGG